MRNVHTLSGTPCVSHTLVILLDIVLLHGNAFSRCAYTVLYRTGQLLKKERVS